MDNFETLDENDPLFLAMVRDTGGKDFREVARRIEEVNAQADKAKFLEAPTVVNDLRHETTEHDSRNSHEPIPNIGPYRLIRQIGRGGFGRVFKGYHQNSPDRKVAVKVYDNRWLDDLERLEIEKLVVQKLKHPNLVTAIDSGEEIDGTSYLVMNHVDGIRIDEFVQQQRLGFNQIARMFGQIAKAMDYAHAQDVVHRDLKPGNILITDDGVPVVTDFGLAKRLNFEGGRSLTATGALIGTLGYLAPEQADSKRREVTRAADVYGLGATLYQVLTGHAPFERDNLLKALDELRTQAPVTPSSFNADIPLDLERICLKCLEKLPHDRYASMQALAEDLQRFNDGRPVSARPPGWHQRWWRWSRDNPLIGGLSFGLGLAVVSGLVASTIFWQRAVSQQEQTAQWLTKAVQFSRSNDQAAENMLVQTSDTLEFRFQRLLNSVNFLDELIGQFPDDDLLYRESATSHFRLGKVSCNQGKWEAGLQAYQTALERFRKLAAAYPDDHTLQFDVFHSLMGLDNVDRNFLGMNTKEEGKLTEAYEIIQRLVDNNPENTDYRDALLCTQGLICFRRFKTDSPEAIELMEEAYQEAVRLKAEFPAPCLQWRHVGGAAFRIASIHYERNDLDQAEIWLRTAFSEIREFLTRPDFDPGERMDLAGCLKLASLLEKKKGNSEKAADYARQWREYLEESVEKYPDYYVFREALSQSSESLGEEEERFYLVDAAVWFCRRLTSGQ